jgi:hypothetical protein
MTAVGNAGQTLPRVATQQMSIHWLRHTTLPRPVLVLLGATTLLTYTIVNAIIGD